MEKEKLKMNDKIACEKCKWELFKDSLRNHFLVKLFNKVFVKKQREEENKFSESGSNTNEKRFCKR